MGLVPAKEEANISLVLLPKEFFFYQVTYQIVRRFDILWEDCGSLSV